MGEIGEFWRDVKEDRKRKKAENPPHRRCWDWIIVSGQCHYAKNRSSFVTYRRVGRSISQGLTGGETFVAGIGTVQLKVPASKKKGSPIRTLVLDDVLHIPSAICNGFCMAKYHTLYGGTTSFGHGMSGTDSQGHPLWYGKPFCGVDKLVLAGNPQGESYLENEKKEGASFMLSMYINKKDLEET